jgi:hypothetical protein
MHELAQELAARAMEKQPDNDASGIERGISTIFERALSRRPSSTEVQLIQPLLAQASSAEADEQREAWAAVARAVMNTDEFLTRE